jgi:hypothetical protein
MLEHSFLAPNGWKEQITTNDQSHDMCSSTTPSYQAKWYDRQIDQVQRLTLLPKSNLLTQLTFLMS